MPLTKEMSSGGCTILVEAEEVTIKLGFFCSALLEYVMECSN